MFTVSELPQSCVELWDAFVEAHPSKSIFHKSLWLSILEKNQNCKCTRLIINRDGVLFGILPFFSRNYIALKVAASPYVVQETPYLGLLVDGNHISASLLSTVNNYFKRHGFSFVRLVLGRDVVTDDFNDENYVIKVNHTHILDLAPDETTLWMNLEGRCRTSIRKALKCGVEIAQVSDDIFIDTMYSMLTDLYARQKMVVPNTRKFYTDLWSNFPRDNLTGFIARYNGVDAAAAMIALSGESAYYLTGATYKQHNSAYAGNLIQWEIIRHLKNIGVSRYDFVGSDIERLAKFKKSFGGRVSNYNVLEFSNSKWVEKLRKIYVYAKKKFQYI